MINQLSTEDMGYFARPREVFIRLALLAAVAASCFVLLRPFLTLIVAGIIIAIGVYPGYRMLTNVLRGRKKLAATLCTLLLLAVVIVPCVLLGGTLVDGIRTITHEVQAGKLTVPPPPPSLDTVPVIGPRLTAFWLCAPATYLRSCADSVPKSRNIFPRCYRRRLHLAASCSHFLFLLC